MLFVVLFEDNPDAADQRNAHMAAHLAFLTRHKTQIQAAGPLTDEAGEGAGGLWLVDARDAEAVRTLVESDPLWPTGLRRSVRILSWRQVFAAGAVV